MKLSILVSMYNAEDYIIRCLNSLSNQDIPEESYEVLIMNDGSSDSSKLLVEEYMSLHSNVCLFSQKNMGNFSARNGLLKKAKGEYIYFVDSDDYVAYNSLGTILETAQQNDLDLMGFEMLLTKKTDETTFVSEIDLNTDSMVITDGLQYIQDHKNMRVEVCWYFIKRSFLEKYKITYHEAKFHMDVLFTYDLFLKAERVAYLPLSIYRYFQSENSIMRSTGKAHNLKRIKNTMILVLKLSHLINGLEKEKGYGSVIDTIRFKRDSFLFFLFIKIFKTGIPLRELREKIATLESVNSYPFYSFIGKEHNTLQFKILNCIFNRKTLFFPVYSFSKFTSIFNR